MAFDNRMEDRTNKTSQRRKRKALKEDTGSVEKVPFFHLSGFFLLLCWRIFL